MASACAALSAAQRQLVKALAAHELERKGVPESSIVKLSLAVECTYKSHHGTIRTLSVDVDTGCSIEQEGPSSSARAAAAAPPTPSPPPAAAAAPAAPAAPAASEQVDHDATIDLPVQPYADDAAAETEEDEEAAGAAVPADVELIELDTPGGTQQDSGPATGRKTSSCSYAFGACSVLAANLRKDSNNLRKPWIVSICISETDLAPHRRPQKRRCCGNRRRVYLCTADEQRMQQLQASLQGAKSWTDVQRCVKPFVSDDVLQGLAGMACQRV